MAIKTGIYYYTWYNEERWKEAGFKYTPLVGQYDSGDPAIISWQLDLIRYCRIDYVIFELIPEDDWAFATVERGIDAAITYMRRNGMQWSFLLDAKNCPSNTVVEHRADFAVIERMYRYLLKQRWMDGLVQGPSGRPLLFVFSPVYEDALLVREELATEIEFRMPIFLPASYWDTFVDVEKVIPPRYLEQVRLRLGGGDIRRAPLFDFLVALGYVSFWEGSATVRNYAGFSPIIPGYDDSLLKRFPQLAPKVSRRGGETFRAQVLAAARNRPEHVVIYGWNEYYEGTSIEPSKQFGMKYVELLRSLIGDLRGAQDGEARNDKTLAESGDRHAVVAGRSELKRSNATKRMHALLARVVRRRPPRPGAIDRSSEEAITWAYRLFLDREPEDASIVAGTGRRLANNRDIRHEFMHCEEFRAKNPSLHEPTLSGMEPPLAIDEVHSEAELQALF